MSGKKRSSKVAVAAVPEKKPKVSMGLFCDTVDSNERAPTVTPVDSFAISVPTVASRSKEEVHELTKRFETPDLPNKASSSRMRQLDTFAPKTHVASSTTMSVNPNDSSKTVGAYRPPPSVFKAEAVIEVPECDIDTMQFSFMSTEEVLKWSVLEINVSKLSGNNTVFDLRMGPAYSNSVEECATCRQKGKVCPGHFGHIKLPCKVPHPLRIKQICDYLNLFCHECFHCVVRDKAEIDPEVFGLKGERKFNAFLNVRKRIEICPSCSCVLPEIKVMDDIKFESVFKGGKKFPLTIKKIEEIFDNIPPCDIELLGLDKNMVHPSNLLMGALLVMPPCARPPVTRSFAKGSNGPAHDDLTINYTEIVKTVNKYIEADKAKNEKNKTEAYENLCFRLRTMMDNSKNKAKNNLNKRGLKCIKKRMTSKTGLIRGHIQGKRVDYCARSVITPEAVGWVDELVVPAEFAKTITFPIRVTTANYEACLKMMLEDKVANIYSMSGDSSKNVKKVLYTPGFDLRDNDVIIRELGNGRQVHIDVYTYREQNKKLPDLIRGDSVVRYNKRFDNVAIRQRKTCQLSVGDTIERYLMDGDWTLFNRQPTLWKGSMRAMRVKVMPGKTFRFNMACTQAYNADHDGGKYLTRDDSFACTHLLFR